MNPPESMKNDETKKIFDLQVLSACIKQPGAITYFAEHINPDDVGKIHGYMGIHEFYKALLNLFKETKLDPIDINAAKGWILAETDIADALGGEPGLASFLAELDVLDTAEYTSIVKIVAARAKKRKQLDHVQKMKEEIQKLDTSPDEISKLTDQIRILAKELDNNPMEKVRTADHIAAGIDELWEIPPFLPTQFPQLNRAMGYHEDKGGFFRGGVHCIAALSGQGKSTLARSLCNHWLDEGYSVLFINFEEPKAHWERILMTQVIQENVYVLANSGTSQDLAKYTSIFHDKLSEWGDRLMVRHDPDTLFFEDLEMWLRDVQGHGVKPDIVVIDTIQSMFSKTGGRARWGEFEQMMVGLEKLAKDMDAVFIITAQQNINSTREKREKLDQSDMGGSITITQKSTVAMMLTPQKSSDDFSPDQTKHDTSIMEIQIIKNRITGTEYKDAPPLVEYDDRIKSYKAYDPKQDPEYVKITLDPLEHGGFGTY